MYIGRMYCVADNGLRSPRIDLYIAPANRFENCSRVERCLIKGGVAVDCRYTQELNFDRVLRAEEDGIGVLAVR